MSVDVSDIIFVLSCRLFGLQVRFGRLLGKNKLSMLSVVLIFCSEMIVTLCYFLKIMLFVTEIMLLRFKEDKDHRQF